MQRPTDEKTDPLSNQVVRTLLFSNGGTCGKFFNGIAPTNLYREPTTRLMLERYIRLITRFNVYLDAVVEKREIPLTTGCKTLSSSKE